MTKKINIAILIGRAGSKGFPGKNTIKILGRNCCEYPIIASKNSKKIDKYFVLTDCKKIKKSLKKYKPILFLEIGVCSASKWNREYGDESMPPSHEKVFDFLKKIGYNSYQIKINGSYSGDTIFLNPLKHTNEIQTFNRLVRDLI